MIIIIINNYNNDNISVAYKYLVSSRDSCVSWAGEEGLQS